jgi:hypothetical protein
VGERAKLRRGEILREEPENLDNDLETFTKKVHVNFFVRSKRLVAGAESPDGTDGQLRTMES